MAKFEVMVTEHLQQSVKYILTVTKKEVVDGLGLEGDDAKEWKDHVQDYVEADTEGVLEGPNCERGDVDGSDTTQVDVDSVTDLE
jgi:hypothetical protein